MPPLEEFQQASDEENNAGDLPYPDFGGVSEHNKNKQLIDDWLCRAKGSSRLATRRVNSCVLIAQDFVKRNGDVIEINNGHIIREIQHVENAFYSSLLSMADADKNYILKSREFSFLVNGSAVDGFSGWDLAGIENISDDRSRGDGSWK